MGRARAPCLSTCLVPPCLVIPPGEWRRPAVYNDWRAHRESPARGRVARRGRGSSACATQSLSSACVVSCSCE